MLRQLHEALPPANSPPDAVAGGLSSDGRAVSSAWGVTGEEGFVYNLRRELTLESAGPCDDDRALYEP